MRVDHFAYQRATRVASFGLVIQFVIALVLFLFSRFAGDTAFFFASLYAALGVILWVGLIIIFNQHKLERLEALEEDELAANRAGATSVFDMADEEIRVAARRLRVMHTWLMPILSVVLAFLLAGIAVLMVRFMRGLGDPDSTKEFLTTDMLGWSVAICLAFAAMAFIISRFIAGMAKQTAWQNLRGGAAFMVGNALVMLAVAIGIIFRFFGNDAINEAMGYAIPIFMMIFAVEIVLNLLLNFYRPRVPGEVPRPAFDSKLLSLFAAPDNLVRSINEAINYQFGFDVTSTWGYQLLLRSFGALLLIGIAVLVMLNTMVIVEPHQQAIRLRGGELVGEGDSGVYDAGLMWKYPWPFESAEVYDVSRVRSIAITARRTRDADLYLWEEDLEGKTDVPLEPFIVQSSRQYRPSEQDAAVDVGGESALIDSEVNDQVALVDLEIALDYRIRDDKAGLLQYLHFGTDQIARRQRLTERERMLRIIAERAVTQHLFDLPLEDVLEQQNGMLADTLMNTIQTAYDDPSVAAGIEVVAVKLMMVRPSSGRVAKAFEELPISRQAREQRLAEARQKVASEYARAIGDLDGLDPLLDMIDEYNEIRQNGDLDDDATIEALSRLELDIERRIVSGGGQAALIISNAQTDRWVRVIDQRAQAERVKSELAAYRAAPELFRQMRTMSVLSRSLASLDKYIVGVDPERLDINVDIKKIESLLNFSDSQGEDPEN
ncbi:MAG: SPFH domain-containing protein [Planctomycetota bacterium]